MVAFKSTVRFKKLTPALLWILNCVHKVSHMHQSFPEIVITSVNDSKHMENSRHYTDEAIDIRTRNFPDMMTKKVFINTLSRELNRSPEALITDRFTVLHESIGTPNEHFHVQVNKGMTYP